MLVYIVFLYFVGLFIYGLLNKIWGVGLYLIGVYAFSAFCSIWLLKHDVFLYNPTFLPSIVYLCFLTICFVPFFRKKPIIHGFKDLKAEKRFLQIGYIVGTLFLLMEIATLPQVQFAFDYGVGDLRSDLGRGETEFKGGLISSLLSTALYWLGNLSYPILTMFFYSLCFMKGRLTFKLMLLIASLGHIIMGLVIGGRTNVFYWVMYFGLCLAIFNPYLTIKKKQYVYSISIPIFILLCFYISTVTIGRFADTQEGAGYSLWLYAGQSYINWCDWFDNVHWHPFSFNRLFPLTSFFFDGSFDLTQYRYLIHQNTGMSMTIFYTFMGDIFVDIGLLGLTIYIFLYQFISRRVLNGYSFDLTVLLYLCIVTIIPLHGLFFYSLWKPQTTFCILLTVLIAKYLRRIPKVKKIEY